MGHNRTYQDILGQLMTKSKNLKVILTFIIYFQKLL